MRDTTKKDTAPSGRGQGTDPLKGFWNEFKVLIDSWRPCFQQGRTWQRATDVLMGLLACEGRGTITNSIIHRGLEQESWCADYDVFNRESSAWGVRDLFKQVLIEGVKELPSGSPITIALDDTGLVKWGKEIPQVGWIHNGLAPKFAEYPICRGIRMLHASLIIPEYVDHRPLAISVAFEPAPAAPKLKKRVVLTKEERLFFEDLKKDCSLPRRASRLIKHFREVLDEAGYKDRILLLVVDGSYTNGEVVKNLPGRTQLIGRFRKNARLCTPPPQKVGKVIYGTGLPTPEEIRQSDVYPEFRTKCHFGKGFHTIRYKQLYRVYWPEGTRSQLMRMFIVMQLPRTRVQGKRKKGWTLPAYLITTDLTSPAPELLQAYFDRWQIEQLHRDLKTGIGVGQVQVFSELANERIHGAQVATYSMLLLAGHRRLGGRREEIIKLLPKWRNDAPERLSQNLLVGLFRNALVRSGYFKRRLVKTKTPLPKGVIIPSSQLFQVA